MGELGINPKLLIAQLINFLLFFYIFRKFISKPFLKFVQEQKKREKANELYQKKLKEIEKKEKEILEKARKKADQEAKEIIKSTKQAAEKLREQLMQQVKEEVEQERKRLKEQLKQEREEFEKQMEKRVYELALKITEKTLEDFMDESLKKKFTQHLLKNLKEIKA